MVCLFHFNTLTPFLKLNLQKISLLANTLSLTFNKKKILSKHGTHHSLLEGTSSL